MCSPSSCAQQRSRCRARPRRRRARAGARICRRLKASSCRVSCAARSAALRISSISSRAVSTRARSREREIGVAEDGAEQVVEVVGDAAGEPADRLHLLRLAQLQLELATLGHVGHRADDANRGAMLTADDVAAIEHGRPAAVPSVKAILARPEGISALDRRPEGRGDALPIVGMQLLHPAGESGLDAAAPMTERGVERVTVEDRIARDVPVVDQLARGGEHELVPLLARAELLGQTLLGARGIHEFRHVHRVDEGARARAVEFLDRLDGDVEVAVLELLAEPMRASPAARWP